MNTFETIEKSLAQLGSELGTQPDLAARVLSQVRTLPREEVPRAGARRISIRRLVSIGAALGLAAAFAAWMFSAPPTLYGRMTAALECAKTVHITGWTRDVVRLWPLEVPPTSAPAADARYPIEGWFWTGADGHPASYEKLGPVVRLRRRGTLREYQHDVKLLYLSDGLREKDFVGRFSAVAQYLKAFDEPGVARKTLGNRTEGERTLKGWQVTRGERIDEFWLDARTDLPVHISRSSKSGEQKSELMELTFTFDRPVPTEITGYEPPETKNIRYGARNANASLAWREHVQEIGERLRDKSINPRGELLLRENGRTFDLQWAMPTPDGKHWVVPIDERFSNGMSLGNFLRNRVETPSGDAMSGTWRVPRELQKLEIPRLDLVYASGTPWHDWVSTVLDRFGLEFTDVVEDRTVWLARHDGRQLKPWREVKPPVSYLVQNGVEQRGVVKPGVGFKQVPVTMEELFQDFNAMIDSRDFAANLPIIFDETGLPKPPAFDSQKYTSAQEFRDQVVIPEFGVATDSPWFVGEESLPLARTWYAEQFGITFVEEVRPVTVHVVRKKAEPK